MCVSLYRHWKTWNGFRGSLDVFVDAFLNDVAGYHTPAPKNVLGYWELSRARADSDGGSVLFIFYEEMKRDVASVIRRASAFLDRPVAEGDIPGLVDHLSFQKMQENSAVNAQEMMEVLTS